eukprot:GEMP01030664.1.p1 GENE.GEMP01030664.1~~GEMP01030664.1.p1  ORF type:complete len:206 (+),score=20.29 GEMP01030664.1:195-812(+)
MFKMFTIPTWVFMSGFFFLCMTIFGVIIYILTMPAYVPGSKTNVVIMYACFLFLLGSITGLVFFKFVFVILKPGGPRHLPRFSTSKMSNTDDGSPRASDEPAGRRPQRSVILQSMEVKILGTDRLECLEKMLPTLDFITKDEADEIVALFPGEAHAVQAYDILEPKILTDVQARQMKKKGTLTITRLNSRKFVSDLKTQISMVNP